MDDLPILSPDERARLGREGHEEAINPEESVMFHRLTEQAFTPEFLKDPNQMYRQFGLYWQAEYVISLTRDILKERSIDWASRHRMYRLHYVFNIVSKTNYPIPGYFPYSEILEQVNNAQYPQDQKSKIDEPFQRYFDDLTDEMKFIVFLDRVENSWERHANPDHREGWLRSVEYMRDNLPEKYRDTYLYELTPIITAKTRRELWGGHKALGHKAI